MVDWIIIGGESGPRVFNPAWALNIIWQCEMAGIPVFMKQFGSRPLGMTFKHPKGENPDEWPEEFRIQQFPGGSIMEPDGFFFDRQAQANKIDALERDLRNNREALAEARERIAELQKKLGGVVSIRSDKIEWPPRDHHALARLDERIK